MAAIMLRIAPLIALCAAFSATALEAQSADNQIVVTGQHPLSREETLDAVRRVARPVGGQLARFNDPICPRVTGFATQYEAIVAERIKLDAEAVGAGAAPEGCVTNLYVVIVDDAQGFVRELRNQHPEAFSGLSKREFEALAADVSSALSWSQTVLTNSMGQAASNPSSSAGLGTVKTGFQGSSVTFDGGSKVLRVYETSTINPSVRQSMLSAWVVIETGATFGKSLRQIADYSAMRGLAMVRPSELDGSEDTILHLFSPDATAAASELTAFDTAYLKGLYRMASQRWAQSQVRYIANSIARETSEASP
jgi:hypothetical protein